MGVDLKRIYAKVAETKQATQRGMFVKVSNNGAILGVNGSREKVGKAVKNLYASKHDIIDFKKLEETDLSKYHMILIGSHDKKVEKSDKLQKYIEKGGYLVTTDRCLATIISKQFPDTIAFEKEEIKGGTFKGEITNPEHPFVRGANKKKTLKFHVEDKAHPIKKIGPNVENIAASKKLEKKYGSGATIVSFRYGEGMIVYMLSKLHPSQANEDGHFLSAYLLTNILDLAVSKAIPDEIRRPTDPTQMAYVNMVVIDEPTQKCVFCGSTFQEFEGKIFRCGSCGNHYHEFCLEQQMARDGTCTSCSGIMIFEKFKGQMDAAAAPRYFQPPAPPPEPEKKEEQKEEKKEEKKEEPPPPPPD